MTWAGKTGDPVGTSNIIEGLVKNRLFREYVVSYAPEPRVFFSTLRSRTRCLGVYTELSGFIQVP